MTALAKVQARGQITLPRDVRKAVGIRPGDTLLLHPTGPHSLEIRVLPQMPWAEALERYRVDGPVDIDALMAEVEDDMAADALKGFTVDG